MSDIKWGIWNGVTKRFCWGIKANSKEEALDLFAEKAPREAQYLWRYEVRKIPAGWKNSPNPNYEWGR